jgi:hypothetical protein
MLYRLTLAVAAFLGLLVVLAPWLPVQRGGDVWAVTGSLFAQDETLRKTAVISASGLWVTAVVFFRTPRRPAPPRGP